MYLMTLTFLDDQLDAVQVRDRWLSPQETLDALTMCHASSSDVCGVRWKTGGVVVARACERSNHLRIGAGTYGALTVLTAE
jgi:hypothetical protein